MKSLIGVDLWRSLHERYIKIGILWQDRVFKTWHAYGHFPRDNGDSYWNGDGDALKTGMGTGATPVEAVRALIANPNFKQVDGVQRASAIAAIEIGRLTKRVRRYAEV